MSVWSHSSSLHGLCIVLYPRSCPRVEEEAMEEIGVHHQFGKDYPQMPMLQVYTRLDCHGKGGFDLSPLVMIYFNSRKVCPQKMGMNELPIMLYC